MGRYCQCSPMEAALPKSRTISRPLAWLVIALELALIAGVAGYQTWPYFPGAASAEPTVTFHMQAPSRPAPLARAHSI